MAVGDDRNPTSPTQQVGEPIPPHRQGTSTPAPARSLPPPPMPTARASSTPHAPAGSASATGLDATFKERVNAMIAASGGRVWIVSGYRSNERQAQLFAVLVKKYGSEKAARKWVAPPGKSHHNMGIAADLGGDLGWVHQNASQFGLYFPMSWEPWHIEPAGSRGGKMEGGALWSGARATQQGYTTAREGYSLNTDPGSADPRKSLDYQIAQFGSMLGSPDFVLGAPAALPPEFTSMPTGTA